MKTDLRKVEFYEIVFDLVPYLSERACRKIHKQVGEVGFEDAVARALKHAPNKKGGYRFKNCSKDEDFLSKDLSLIDDYWEKADPNPDIHALFLQFNEIFFWKKLTGVEVRWSPRMTLCAGLCSYEGRGGLCSVRLSVPLLNLRPRSDLVNTLLHEMIHVSGYKTDGRPVANATNKSAGRLLNLPQWSVRATAYLA
ncbi:SprT-like domain-containing protein Spartan [Nymphon striatum]|nr:SprT-like domain-containing protein Spartan [Nymphon striatum]